MTAAKMTQDEKQAILKAIRSGRTQAQGCTDAGIALRSFQRWLSQDEALRQEVEEARRYAQSVRMVTKSSQRFVNSVSMLLTQSLQICKQQLQAIETITARDAKLSLSSPARR